MMDMAAMAAQFAPTSTLGRATAFYNVAQRVMQSTTAGQQQQHGDGAPNTAQNANGADAGNARAPNPQATTGVESQYT